ncbi:predicted protein [Naegleria gruberi]|uniref:Predicted protein n=1 Tax=Naegleria gruberi TaxID=5762 RepID=D2V4E4_NAEGR|nr:uncharacterized protein NAEGRDRAFT_63696 [Naegleria gruberi]EFC48499.1 predicted protein [Naegleria gruberi]|eukprot:XP_002681243.1 predicted protein [Naegleria gruberi strain NEG-M]
MKQFNYQSLMHGSSLKHKIVATSKFNNILIQQQHNIGTSCTTLNNFKSFTISKQLSSSSEVKRICIVGGGAAGLNCTKFAQSKALSLLKSNKNQKIEILLLERKPQCGRKIIMSGGSRCNLIPHESKWLSFKKENDLELKYFSSRPDILFQILKTWPIEQQKVFFEKELKIPLELEVESGKYFPQSNDAKDVLDAFLKSITDKSNERVKVSILNNCDVKGLEKTERGWNVKFSHNDRDNQSVLCKSVVMSTGGLSVINSDGVGVQLLSQLGHSIVPMYPALTPLVSDSKVKLIHKELSGLTIPNVILTVCLENGSERKVIYQMEEPKGFLFTHTGYSGPACLNPSHATIPGLYNFETQRMKDILVENPPQSSSLIEKSQIERLLFHSPAKPPCQLKLYVNWTPLISAQEWDRKFQQAKQKNSKLVLKNFIHKNSEPNFLPIRLVQLITDSLAMSDLLVSRLSNDQRRSIISHLTSFPLDIGGNKGFKMAEVTGGGVDLSQINIPSMESKIHPNLFLCGEVLDAFGRIGGFNFALAWITSRLAGTSCVEQVLTQ